MAGNVRPKSRRRLAPLRAQPPHKEITRADLLPGDVLLSLGKKLESSLIRIFTGGAYSHSGIWDGDHSIDASDDGVKPRDLAYVLDRQRYVDAYRWHSRPPEHELRAPDYPDTPVIAYARQIVADGTAFATDELVMAAFAIAVTRVQPTVALRLAARMVMNHLEHWIHTHITGKVRAMICTEVVCSAYWEASPDRRYAVNVRLAESRAAELVRMAERRAPRQKFWNLDVEDTSPDAYLDVRAECARLVLASVGPAMKAGIQASAARRPSLRSPVDAPAGGGLVPVGCVTPRDLQDSPSLRLLGRIRA